MSQQGQALAPHRVLLASFTRHMRQEGRVAVLAVNLWGQLLRLVVHCACRRRGARQAAVGVLQWGRAMSLVQAGTAHKELGALRMLQGLRRPLLCVGHQQQRQGAMSLGGCRRAAAGGRRNDRAFRPMAQVPSRACHPMYPPLHAPPSFFPRLTPPLGSPTSSCHSSSSSNTIPTSTLVRPHSSKLG